MTLPPDCEKRIAEHIELDYFDSPEDVMRAALDALGEKLIRDQKRSELLREIDIGIADADAGRVMPFDEAAIQSILIEAQRQLSADQVEAGS